MELLNVVTNNFTGLQRSDRLEFWSSFFASLPNNILKHFDPKIWTQEDMMLEFR